LQIFALYGLTILYVCNNVALKISCRGEIKAFCKAEMAPRKVPGTVEFIEQVPRSTSGKALRRMLRDKECV
jgi:acyl-coenzyme A synthetase/AMP-(fatty) acid ligase